MMMSPKTRNWSLYATTGLIVLLWGVCYRFELLHTFQAQLTDRFFSKENASPDIIIIDIDEESLAAIGQWPWPRSVHAQLLQNLSEAKMVGFDVLFTEPSRVGASDDETFATALSEFKGTIVLPAVIDEQSGRITYPIEILRAQSTSGFVNTSPDRDGVVRYAPLQKNELPGFDTRIAGNQSTLRTVFVYYRGPAKTYTTISYADVYQGAILKEFFAGKTILIGASAAGLGDMYQTPFGAMPGVEIHANTIETLRLGHIVTELPRRAGYVFFLVIALMVLGTLLTIHSFLRLIGVLFGIAVSVVAFAYAAFIAGVIIPHLYALLLLASLGGTLVLIQYLFESKEKRFIRSSFEHYVAPEVIAELYSQPDKLSLGGETRSLTILFSDIRGFTAISESLTPQALMLQLNEYLEEMSEAVMNHKGLVDKYIGDAVMAFWGAPLKNERHAKQACESVIAMKRALEKLNQKWVTEGRPTFTVGIGVSTGDVVVGNMGSRRRFNYSIIGDEVNFASRIESLTKQYGVTCIIGAATYEAIKDVSQFTTRELDDVMVKGKRDPRRIYELITTDLSPTVRLALEQFALGREKYKEGNFADAVTLFAKALEFAPDDGPSKVFLERSEVLLHELPRDWSGVFEFKSK